MQEQSPAQLDTQYTPTPKDIFDFDCQRFKLRQEAQIKLLELKANLAEKSTDKYITLATAALGGTIYYADKISSQVLTIHAYPLLFVGCVALIMAIGAFLFVRTLNNRDIGAALEGKFDESLSLSGNSLSLGSVARLVFIVAITFLTFFFLFNFPTSSKQKGTCLNDKQQPTQYYPYRDPQR